MPTSVVRIGGAVVGCPVPVLPKSVVVYRVGGTPSASFEVRGGPLAALPDPYTGKEFSIDVDGARIFTGDVVGIDPDFVDRVGWLRRYMVAGLRHRGDKFRHRDSNTGIDTSVYNASQDNQSSDFTLSRSGRTVGQILTDVLTMSANAATMAAYGLGNLTFPAGVPTLPSDTIADLAALTLIPQAPVYFGGQQFLSAVEQLLSAWAPNHCLDLDQADGTLRIRDLRAFSARTLTMGSDPIQPTSLRRDVSQCFQRVEVVGQPVAKMFAFPLSTGGLNENPFAHDGLTIAQAIADWLPSDYQNPGQAAGQATAAAGVSGGAVNTASPVAVGYGYTPSTTLAVAVTGGGGSGCAIHGNVNSSGQVAGYTIDNPGTGFTSAPSLVVPSPAGTNSDTGTVVCNSTTTVTLTSTNPSLRYPANFWDYSSTGREGTLFLSYSAGTGITTYDTVAVVANAALTAGGSAIFTLAAPLPHLLFDGYRLTGLTKGASDVWRRYGLPAWAAAVATQQTTYPFALNLASGSSATLASSAIGMVEWSSSGSPPYQQAAAGITVDTASGTVLFAYPTFLLAGGPPAEVIAFVPINTASNVVAFPPDTYGAPNYAGTSNTYEGLTDTLEITCPSWRDPANAGPMADYASDVLDSVKDAVIEGEVEILGFDAALMTMGTALNVAGNGYPTGWEAGAIPALPVVECTLHYNKGGLLHTTTTRCSNRRARFGSEAFLRPDRTGVVFDWGSAAVNEGGGRISGTESPHAIGVDQVNTSQAADVASQTVGVDQVNASQAADVSSQVVDPFSGS